MRKEINLKELCKCGHERRFHEGRRGDFNMECLHQNKDMQWDNFESRFIERHFRDCSCKKFESAESKSKMKVGR